MLKRVDRLDAINPMYAYINGNEAMAIKLLKQINKVCDPMVSGNLQEVLWQTLESLYSLYGDKVFINKNKVYLEDQISMNQMPHVYNISDIIDNADKKVIKDILHGIIYYMYKTNQAYWFDEGAIVNKNLEYIFNEQEEQEEEISEHITLKPLMFSSEVHAKWEKYIKDFRCGLSVKGWYNPKELFQHKHSLVQRFSTYLCLLQDFQPIRIEDNEEHWTNHMDTVVIWNNTGDESYLYEIDQMIGEDYNQLDFSEYKVVQLIDKYKENIYKKEFKNIEIINELRTIIHEICERNIINKIIGA